MEGDAERLMALFRTDAKRRDDLWRDRLNAAFWPARLDSVEPRVVQNDATGHRCYRVGPARDGVGNHVQEPAGLVDWAIGQGQGFVLWPGDEPQPIWEFSLGDVLSYRLYGTAFAPRFWNEPPDDGGFETVQEVEAARVGEPNAEMFPPLVRQAVRRVMKGKLGIREPKVVLLQRGVHGSRLVFELHPDDLGDGNVALAFAKIGWCIPSCIPIYRVDGMVGNPAMEPF